MDFHGCAVAHQRLLADVERERAETQPLRRDRRLAGRHLLSPQQRADAGHEFVGEKRLRQVIVGARLETDDLVRGVAFRGEHQDRQRLAFRAQAPAHAQAVLGLHHQVEHQQVVRFALEQAVEPLAVGDRAHLEAVAGQEALQHVAQLGFVVEHDDPAGLFHRLPPGACAAGSSCGLNGPPCAGA